MKRLEGLGLLRHRGLFHALRKRSAATRELLHTEHAAISNQVLETIGRHNYLYIESESGVKTITVPIIYFEKLYARRTVRNGRKYAQICNLKSNQFVGLQSSKWVIWDESFGCIFLLGSMCAEGMGCERRWVRWVLLGIGTANGHPGVS